MRGPHGPWRTMRRRCIRIDIYIMVVGNFRNVISNARPTGMPRMMGLGTPHAHGVLTSRVRIERRPSPLVFRHKLIVNRYFRDD